MPATWTVMAKEKKQDQNSGLSFMLSFVRNRKFMPSFGSSIGYNPSAIGSFHSGPEAMFIFSFPAGRLKCPFHVVILSYGLLVIGIILL
jgi:hypothetical protein